MGSLKGVIGAAHPRAGGENVGGDTQELPHLGSSPRGRGKPACEGGVSAGARLIPARAGKTYGTRRAILAVRAHPRAGGENVWEGRLRCRTVGSSPRGRGKLVNLIMCEPRHRLIPARAGKTRPCR